MRCIIAGNSVKLFAKAIHCLAKIGEEIYLEPLSKGLSLRSVNSSRSAYACFLFLLNFFQSYDDGARSIPSDRDTPPEDVLKCKLSVKSCLSVFKSLSTIEKIVDRCSIKMDLNEATLTFLLYCRHGITKTYNLSYQDCESLQAVFTKDLCPNVIVAQPRIFSEVVVNFQNTQEEITLSVCPQHMKVTNYVDDEPDPERVIHTEMVLVPEEFDNYQIGVDTEVTFCLKELKGILTFSESTGQTMDIHFEHGGKPIVFSLTSDPTFEANFVLATLVDQASSSQHSQQTSSKREKTQKIDNSKNDESHCNNGAPSDGDFDDEFGLGPNDDENWEENALAELVDEQIAKETLEGKNKRMKAPEDRSQERIGTQAKNVDTADEDFFEDSFAYQDLFGKKARKNTSQSQTKQPKDNSKQGDGQSLVGPVATQPSFVSGDLSRRLTEMPSLGGSCSADSDKSPGIAVRSGKNKDAKKQVEKTFQENNVPEDTIPGTPPSKKFKSMFFSAMTNSEDISDETTVDKNTSIVLAADTDDESD